MFSKEIALPDWNLLLSRKQDFLENQLAQIAITPNRQGTFEMSGEVLATTGAQDMDTRGYQLSDMEDIEFFWENLQVELGAVFKQGIDTPFSPTAVDDLEMAEGGSYENPIPLDNEEDKGALLSTPTTPVFERPTETPM